MITQDLCSKQNVSVPGARFSPLGLFDDKKSEVSIASEVSCGLQGAALAHLQEDIASLSLPKLMQCAAAVRDQGHQFISFSPKVLPLSAS